MSQSLKILKLKIDGMHCASCEVLIERKFKKVSGVEKVSVNYASGKAEIICSSYPNLHELNNLVKSDGYQVFLLQDKNDLTQNINHKNTWKDYSQMGGIFLVIISSYYLLKEFDFIPSISISEGMSYGVVFLVGLLAATSTCIAVVGGLLLAVSEKFSEMNPQMTGLQKFRPHIYFNIGRILGYTVLGGLVGGLGSFITLSPQVNGYLMIVVSLVMLLLGFQLLHLFPRLQRFSPKMPKFISHKIHDLSIKENKGAPLMLGALTFFLPCGFTQSLQLYVLATGDWKIGGLTMLVFSLGTLPALLSLSVITSFAKGIFQKNFLKFAGVLVVMLAVFNLNNGLTLTGLNFNLVSAFSFNKNVDDQEVLAIPIVNGKQIVDMQVIGLNYTPYRFSVQQGIPVEWRIDGSQAQGCAQVVTVPKLGTVKYLSPTSPTIINFIPQELGSIPFSCSMGMTTRGSEFIVVPNLSTEFGLGTNGIVGRKITDDNLDENRLGCNPEFTTCLVQKVSMEVSRERGFYPLVQTIKRGIPVELTVDDQIPLGGCMGMMTIPEYEIAQLLKIGENIIKFKPTRTGNINVVCNMGMIQTRFNVIN